MDVGIVAQKDNARAAYLADRLRGTLLDEGVTVLIDTATAVALGEDVEGVDPEGMRGCDLVVSIGGDGTFLYTARGVGGTPVLGVNLGEVGFLNAVSPDDAEAAVRAELERYRESGTIRAREVPRVRATGEGWALAPALNEVVVHAPQRGHGNGCSVEVRVDGSLYTGSHADGVLVSTPTGSTAYNLSEGGPLVHPSVGALVVTEMCATEPMPPLVVDEDSEIVVRVDDAPHAFVIGDGREQRRIEPPTRVTVGLADDPVRIAGPSVDFFEALEKLE